MCVCMYVCMHVCACMSVLDAHANHDNAAWTWTSEASLAPSTSWRTWWWRRPPSLRSWPPASCRRASGDWTPPARLTRGSSWGVWQETERDAAAGICWHSTPCMPPTKHFSVSQTDNQHIIFAADIVVVRSYHRPHCADLRFLAIRLQQQPQWQSAASKVGVHAWAETLGANLEYLVRFLACWNLSTLHIDPNHTAMHTPQ